MAGQSMIPGGQTEQLANNGGTALRLQLATLLAGNPVDRVVVALTSETISVLLVAADSLEEANSLVDAFAGDVKNGLLLNWELHHAAARAASEALGEPRTQ